MSELVTGLQQDHLSELVRGQELPLPALDPAHIAFILELLQRAYEGIKADHPEAVSGGEEKDINALMVHRLNHLVGDDPLASLMVRAVSRGTETMNFNASCIEKRPDIQISLTGWQHLFPLIVECKLIDRPKRKTADMYCRDGLARFIRGDYAWTNREAMMLAYVRDGASIAHHLHPFLASAMAKSPPDYSVVTLPQKCFPALPDAAKSIHGRSFFYVHETQSGNTPGNIAIWHLWVHS
ncbi:hypothetical protein [Desulfolutivibrio sp.]|uniref:hypothetical protein n=1 Tax=Desulfolutivibrio sp. TaxID=2773296 RepID=UPI002F966CDB